MFLDAIAGKVVPLETRGGNPMHGRKSESAHFAEEVWDPTPCLTRKWLEHQQEAADAAAAAVSSTESGAGGTDAAGAGEKRASSQPPLMIELSKQKTSIEQALSSEEGRQRVRAMRPLLHMFITFAQRAATQLLREPALIVKDVMLQMLVGAFFGALYAKAEFSNLLISAYMLSLALGLTVALASLRVFGNELIVFWREAAPGGGMGLSKLAYFSAKNVVELPRIALLTLALLSTYYSMTSPRASFLSGTFVPNAVEPWPACFCCL